MSSTTATLPPLASETLGSTPPLPTAGKDPWYRVKVAVMTVVLAGVLVPVFGALAKLPEAPVTTGQWVLLAISAIANIAVIAYHYLVPAHPKFLMLPGRFAVLLVHIVSGSIELIAGVVACFAHSREAAIVQACAALFLHVPSAFLQVRIVFGSKAIMYPAYLLSISLHGFCAAMLLINPDSLTWAVNTFLVFNIYTWCRVYFYIFDRLKLFASMKYTISIFAAGVTMLPALFGPMTMLVLTGFVIIYIMLQRILFIRTPAEYLDFVREKSREGLKAPDMAAFWGNFIERKDDEKIARLYFNGLGRDTAGNVTRAELLRVLAPWGLNAQDITGFADRLLASGPLTFERFLKDVWTIGAVRSHGIQIVVTEEAVSARDKAELVFRYADTARKGTLTVHDLEVLLVEWGLPASEAGHYLARADRDKKGCITFDDFFRQMRPFWRFIYYEVFRAQLSRKGTDDMIGRSASALRDKHRAGNLRKRVEHGLLSHVPFLSGASAELIDDLSASMVEVKYKAGEMVFKEGDAGDAFYIIGAGQVRVSKSGTVLADLGTGGCVGEGALLSDEPRSATVSALQDVTLYSLTRSSFQYLVEKYPAVNERLRALHSQRVVAANVRSIQEELLEQLPFLRHATSALVHDLAKGLVPVRCLPGTLVFREGDPGDSFYIIEKGGVRVMRDTQTLAELGVGGCFGEGSFFSGLPRSATVVAVQASRLFKLHRDAFNDIVERYPEVRRSLLDLHVSRTVDPFRGRR